MYETGKHIEKGLSIDKLKERVSTRDLQVKRTINKATNLNPLYNVKVSLFGDKEIAKNKRKSLEVNEPIQWDSPIWSQCTH